MERLVALAVPGGPRFVDELERAWGAGDAVLPVDLRMPPAGRRALLEAMAPAVLVDEDGATPLAGAIAVEDGDALVVATSGTTGSPKGVVLTHEAVAASARATSARLAVDPGRDRWLACLPLSHVGGLSVVTRALLTGTPLEVVAGFSVPAVEAAADSGATLVALVPTALGRLGGHAARFRAIVLGGQAPPDHLADNVRTTYGLSETGSGVVYDGRPLGGVEVRVVDGEVQLRGPMLLRAYRDGSDPKTHDGWLPTGDAGELAADGTLRVHGRLDDAVITGGENVWPAAVESILRRHRLVGDVAVVGRPDPEWGARVVAFVVPAAGAADGDLDPAALLDDLRALVRLELPAYAAPRELVITGELPTTAIGKVRRRGPGGLEGLDGVGARLG